MHKQITSHSALESEHLGKAMGRNLRGGELIVLSSDLGGGKTTFTRGLAAGFGSLDHVSSPSFTLNREYAAGDKRMSHFDFYRLQEAGIMSDEIMELIGDPKVVVVVEWADIVTDVLPANKVVVTITPLSEDERHISFEWPENLQYVMDKVA